MCLCRGSYMLTYVISRASFSETLKMQPSFFGLSLAKRGAPGDFQCVQMSLVMSMPFIRGDDWNDARKLNKFWHDLIFSK